VEDYLVSLEHFPGPYEFLLVVNGCKDNSLDVCNEIAKIHPTVRVIDSEKKGWGEAVKAGITHARGEMICYTNSARTRPNDLLLFLLYALSNPGVVIKANRKFRDNWRRRLGSLLYNLESRFFFDLSYWDINGTPKIFSRHHEKLLHLTEGGDLIDLEFVALCRQENYPVLEVPVVSFKRRGGKSTTNYLSAFNMYWGAFQLWKKMKPQR
jgi:glycosyltransferase involved in cell wall biosynthesis